MYSKMICPVCFRKIGANRNGILSRHGFRRDRWDDKGNRVDGTPCPGTGMHGIPASSSNSELEETLIEF